MILRLLRFSILSRPRTLSHFQQTNRNFASLSPALKLLSRCRDDARSCSPSFHSLRNARSVSGMGKKRSQDDLQGPNGSRNQSIASGAVKQETAWSSPGSAAFDFRSKNDAPSPPNSQIPLPARMLSRVTMVRMLTRGRRCDDSADSVDACRYREHHAAGRCF